MLPRALDTGIDSCKKKTYNLEIEAKLYRRCSVIKRQGYPTVCFGGFFVQDLIVMRN